MSKRADFIVRALNTVNLTLAAVKVMVQIRHAETQTGLVAGNPERQRRLLVFHISILKRGKQEIGSFGSLYTF